MSTLNTSIAKSVDVPIFDYDNLNVVHKFRKQSDNTVIDLTAYKFEFFLKDGVNVIVSYSINAGVLSNSYLSKTGASHETLNMKLMYEDIRTKINLGFNYELIEAVTDGAGNTFVYLVHKISGGRH